MSTQLPPPGSLWRHNTIRGLSGPETRYVLTLDGGMVHWVKPGSVYIHRRYQPEFVAWMKNATRIDAPGLREAAKAVVDDSPVSNTGTTCVVDRPLINALRAALAEGTVG